MGDRHPNVERVVAAGRELGLEIEPRSFPEGTRTAQEAADAIGVELGQIVKSLIFGVDGEVVLAYVSGVNRLDEKLLAAAAGGSRCERVDADAVRKATGFPIGGVPPFGHSTQLRVFVDPDLLQYDEVWAAAGTWHDVFAIAPADLVRSSGGTVTDLAR
ncbi:MAG: YbaK/EbsC family protein [Actinomycetota bacterium]|nr:YbaK/EbsC family protein [Actinomycetota bacterium]MDA3009346.1 YbaK/EbsC family protein [Actinomycetota bacterium]